jgi:hypothetical protein
LQQFLQPPGPQQQQQQISSLQQQNVGLQQLLLVGDRGMITSAHVREFESDRKWAYYGFQSNVVRHLRLGFYKGDIFTEVPNRRTCTKPVR